MMVIVVGSENKQIEYAHGRLQPRVQGRSEHIFFLQSGKEGHGFSAQGRKLRDQLREAFEVVVGQIRFGVAQISNGQFLFSFQNVVYPRLPQGFEVG